MLRRQIEDLKPRVGNDAAALDTRLIDRKESLHPLGISGRQGPKLIDGLKFNDLLRRKGVPAITVKAAL
jgi:hypothetical protein